MGSGRGDLWALRPGLPQDKKKPASQPLEAGLGGAGQTEGAARASALR